MPDKRDGKITGLNRILDKYLSRQGLMGKSRQMMAALVWAEEVGLWYRQHTTVTRAHDGILTVECDSASRAQQLQLDSDWIREKLNKRLGGNFIKEIRASSGRVGRSMPRPSIAEDSPAPAPPKLASEPLAPGQEQAIQALADEIRQPQVREKFVKAMRNFGRLQRWQEAHGYTPCPQCGWLIEPGEQCLVCHPGRAPQQGEPLSE